MLKRLMALSVAMLALAACETTAEETGTTAGAGGAGGASGRQASPPCRPQVIRHHRSPPREVSVVLSVIRRQSSASLFRWATRSISPLTAIRWMIEPKVRSIGKPRS